MRASYIRRVTFLAVGVGLGLVAGLVFAPRSGKELRDALRKGADGGFARLRTDSDKFCSTASSWLTRLRGIFGDGSGPP